MDYETVDRRIWDKSCDFIVWYRSCGNYGATSLCNWRRTMKLVVEEYGGMLLAMLGTVVMFALIIGIFAEQGQVTELINIWTLGGC